MDYKEIIDSTSPITHIPNDENPKFIMQGDWLHWGHVDYHRDMIVSANGPVHGGGRAMIIGDGRVVLYGASTDYGPCKRPDIQRFVDGVHNNGHTTEFVEYFRSLRFFSVPFGADLRYMFDPAYEIHPATY